MKRPSDITKDPLLQKFTSLILEAPAPIFEEVLQEPDREKRLKRMGHIVHACMEKVCIIQKKNPNLIGLQVAVSETANRLLNYSWRFKSVEDCKKQEALQRDLQEFLNFQRESIADKIWNCLEE
jgi:hypothetical protein